MSIRLFGSEFYFARHGQTHYNAQGLVTGTLDIPLDDVGVVQAKEMAAHISGLPFVSCICSPLDRAQTTAELLLAGRSELIPVAVAGLEERSWGSLEGVSKHDLDNYDFPSNGVEMWDEFVRRTIETLSGVDESIALPVFIVAHSGTFRAICEYLNVEETVKPVKNACPYHFYMNNSRWYVQDCTLR